MPNGSSTSASMRSSMRRAKPGQPGGCDRVSVWKTSSPSAFDARLVEFLAIDDLLEVARAEQQACRDVRPGA